MSMGIYIKGMEMPKSCFDCRFNKMNCCIASIPVTDVALTYVTRSRKDSCPLGPIPPHGRLIEKGTILDKCYQHFEDFMNGIVDGKTALLNIEKEIKAAPTIIPAEEGEA